MSISYNKLWKILIDKNMTKIEFRDLIGMSPNTLAKLSKNEKVSMDILERICKEFDCNFSDIVDYVSDKNK